MRKLVYFIALNQAKYRHASDLENLVFLVRDQDILSYSIHFSEEQAFLASKHMPYDVIIACGYVPENAIQYQVDRLIIRPTDFGLEHIHGYYPDKNNTTPYITNPYFDTRCLPQEESLA